MPINDAAEKFPAGSRAISCSGMVQKHFDDSGRPAMTVDLAPPGRQLKSRLEIVRVRSLSIGPLTDMASSAWQGLEVPPYPLES